MRRVFDIDWREIGAIALGAGYGVFATVAIVTAIALIHAIAG